MILISLLINRDSSFTLYDEFSLLIIVGGSVRVGYMLVSIDCTRTI